MKRRATIIALVLAMLAPEAFAREYSQLDSLKSALNTADNNVDLAETYYSIASILYSTPQKALPYITDALSFAEKSGEESLIAKSGYVFGLINEQLSQTKDAFLGYHIGLEAYASLGDDFYAAECHLGMGRLYLSGHHSDKAKLHFDQAGALLVEEVGDSRGGFYVELGDLFSNEGEYDQAVYYYQLAVDAYVTPVKLAHANIRMGNALVQLGDFSQALESYLVGEEIIEGTEKENEYRGVIESNRGLVSQLLGEFEEAIQKYQSSLDLESGDQVASEQWTLNQMSKCYFALGDTKMASELLVNSIAKGKDEFGSAGPLLESYELAIQVAEADGDISTAFAYQQDYRSHLVSEQRIEEEVSDAKAVLELQMAENEILTAQLAAAERVKLWAVSIAGALGVIVLAMLLIRFINRNKRLQAKFNRKQAAIKELKRMTVSEEWS